MKINNSKFPDYANSPIKVNDLLARQNKQQQVGAHIHSEKKQTSTKLQTLEAMKAQQLQQ